MPANQAKYYLLTIPHELWSVPEELPDGIEYLKGQAEIGESGYRHWQVLVSFTTKKTLTAAKKFFPAETHLEPTKSKAADDYVWKDETSVEGSRFEMGSKKMKRNSAKDWDTIWENAKQGNLMNIPADVRIRSYSTFKKIAVDFMEPVGIVRKVNVYWGPTGTGKSRRAWEEAGLNAYPKDPRSKFWDGYTGQEHVVIDEFDGAIDICHVLRWFDRYPVIVEVKGASVVFKAREIWITSNVDPREWYPAAKQAQQDALMRRLLITEYPFEGVLHVPVSYFNDAVPMDEAEMNEMFENLMVDHHTERMKDYLPEVYGSNGPSDEEYDENSDMDIDYEEDEFGFIKSHGL